MTVERRSKLLHLRVTPSEYARWVDGARREDRPLSQIIRESVRDRFGSGRAVETPDVGTQAA